MTTRRLEKQNGFSSQSLRGRRKSADNDLQNLKRTDPFNTDMCDPSPPHSLHRSKSPRKNGKQSKTKTKTKTPKNKTKFDSNHRNHREPGFPFNSNHNTCNTPSHSKQSTSRNGSTTTVGLRRNRNKQSSISPSMLRPRKKAKLMQAIAAPRNASSASTSSSSPSSDIEVLNAPTTDATRSAPHLNRRHHKHNHHKSGNSSSYNIYGDDAGGYVNEHKHKQKRKNGVQSFLHTSDLELQHIDQEISELERDNHCSVIPFSAEKDRSKVHSAVTENMENHSSVRNTKTKANANGSAVDCDSSLSRVSHQLLRRSKSRSPDPASEVKENMTETADQLALHALPASNATSKIRTRHCLQLLGKNSKPNSKHGAKHYSALTSLPTGAMDAFAAQRHHNPGGRHRPLPRPRRPPTGQFVKLGHSWTWKSSLQCLPVSSANGQTVNVEDMDQSTFAQMLEQPSAASHSSDMTGTQSFLKAFVAETELKTKTKTSKRNRQREKEKLMIDLTTASAEGTPCPPKTNALIEHEQEQDDAEEDDDDDDDDDDDIEILNQMSAAQQKQMQRKEKKKQQKKKKKQQKQKNRDELLQLRKRGQVRFDCATESDIIESQMFDLRFNAQDIPTSDIMQAIERYQQEKRRQMEQEERERKEQAFLEEQQQTDETTKLRSAKFTALHDDDLAVIQKVGQLPAQKMIQRHVGSNIDVCVKDLSTLGPGKWLNDEVMNFYMALLQDRNNHRCSQNNDSGNGSSSSSSGRCRVLLMNTFFYTKLSSNGYNYKAVKRWTKKNKLGKRGLNDIETIFELDKFIFPVHVNGIHWCCGCVNFKHKRIEYFDSMNGRSVAFFATMKKFLTDEWKDKLNSNATQYKLDWADWETESNTSQYPQQQNGYDCGVFTSKCADWISDDLYPDYTQQDMTMFRHRMVIEIVRGKTLDF